MLIPEAWLESGQLLAEKIGAVRADEIVRDLVDEVLEDHLDRHSNSRVKRAIERVAPRVLAARRIGAEVALLRRLEVQIRAGDGDGHNYDPSEVQYLLNQLDVLRCKR